MIKIKQHSKKTSFILYIDSLDVIDELDEQQTANIFRAIIAYQRGHSFKLSKIETIAFIPIKNYMTRDRIKYEEYIESQREYGKLGGRPPKRVAKGSLSQKRVAKGSKGSKGDSVSDTVSVSDNDNDTDTENESESESKKQNTKITTLTKFIERKQDVINKSKVLYQDKDCVKAIADFIEHCQIKKTNYRNYRLAFYRWVREDRFNQYTHTQKMVGLTKAEQDRFNLMQKKKNAKTASQ